MSPPWRLAPHAPLRNRNTLHVDAHAPWLLTLGEAAALPDVLALPQLADAGAWVLGGGSNILFAADPDAALIVLDLDGHAILGDAGDGRTVVRTGAGVGWHNAVMWTLDQGLCGLENLALIPGTCGAAPIQNIGAYGTEVGEFVHAVEAWDRTANAWVRLDAAACAFGYRDSLFKQSPDRYLITAVEYALHRQRAPSVRYAGIADELAAMGIDAAPTARNVADAVVRIRQRKLPDPAVVGNAGSFFKNPVVDGATADALSVAHPQLPNFPAGDTAATDDGADARLPPRKLSAAWMIDACGWKGHRDGDAGISADHALVLVNHGTASGQELLALAHRVAASVHETFGVRLEPEPRLVGATWE